MKAHAETKTRVTKVARGLCGLAMPLMVAAFATAAAGQETTAAKKWPAAAPRAVGLDAATLEALDADLASGTYAWLTAWS
jgi:hypothetical protein